MITLGIVEESEIVKMGLRTFINTAENIEVVCEFAPSRDLIHLVRHCNPDVVVLGLREPISEGIVTCRNLLEGVPSTRVVTMSYYGRDEEMLASMMSGASSCISMSASGNEVLHAVRVAYSGGLYFDWGTTGQILRRFNEYRDREMSSFREVLTQREISVLTLIGAGYSNAEIGARLHLAATTVRNSITMIRTKLGLDSRARLISYAIRNGLELPGVE